MAELTAEQFYGPPPDSAVVAVRAPSYVAGLDLGQAGDYSALAIIECHPVKPPLWDLRHLGRFELQTDYPTVVRDVLSLLGSAQLAGRTTLVVDYTGVGRAVLDMLRLAQLAPIAVTITGLSREARFVDQSWRVPKKDLVAALATGFESRQFRMAAGMPYVEVLQKELRAFRAKVTLAGNQSFEAWREADHDDLVLATALALWWAKLGVAGEWTAAHGGVKVENWLTKV